MNIKELYKKYKEVIWYLIIGVLTTVVNYVVFFVLNILTHYMVANGIAWGVSVIFAYFTNKSIVFNSKKSDQDLEEFIKFVSCRIFSLVIEMIGLYIMVDLLILNENISKIFLNVIVIILNYFFSKFFIFVKKE